MKTPTSPSLSRLAFGGIAIFCLALPAGAATSSSDVANAGTSSKNKTDQSASAKVWNYLFSQDSCPETAGDQPMPNKSGSGIAFQGAQEMWIGGSRADGGIQTLKTADVLEVTCGSGNVKATPFCQKDKDIAKTSCDAAAKIYGVPSAFLICSYAARANYQEKGSSSSSSATGKTSDILNQTETEARQKAEDENFNKARDKYAKMMKPGSKGGVQNMNSRPDESQNMTVRDDGVCRSGAESARRTLNKLEEALLKSQFLTGGKTNCNYFGMIELLAVAQKYGPDAANKMIQNGGNQTIQLMANQRSGEFTQYLDELMKCINKVSEKVTADKYEVGSCDGRNPQ